jgi:hypothetical protein
MEQFAAVVWRIKMHFVPIFCRDVQLIASPWISAGRPVAKAGDWS